MVAIIDSVFGDGSPSQDASSPFATLAHFIGTGLDLLGMSALVEVAGGIGDGITLGGMTTSQDPALTNAPSTPSTPGVDPMMSMNGPSMTLEA